MAVELVFAD